MRKSHGARVRKSRGEIRAHAPRRGALPALRRTRESLVPHEIAVTLPRQFAGTPRCAESRPVVQVAAVPMSRWDLRCRERRSTYQSVHHLDLLAYQ